MYYTSHTQIIDIYFKEIRKNQVLTLEDENNLFKRVLLGDKSAREEIFNRMAKAAVAEAKKFTGNPDLLCDLIQEANMGLLEAIDKFDISLGNRFSSFAKWWVRAYIIKYLDMMHIVRKKSTNLDKQVKKIKNEFQQKMGRKPSDYEVLDILDAMGVKVNDLSYLHELCIDSINDSFEDSDEEMEATGEMSMRLSVQNEYEDTIETDSLITLLRQKMRVLTDREKRLVALKFGIGQDFELDYDAIAEREGLTSERVRQIVTGAIKKMK